MKKSKLRDIYQNLSGAIEFERFEKAVTQFEELMAILSDKQKNDETHYTGADLNLLESLPEKIWNSTITMKDFYEMEKMIFRFM